jgi:hypothetical protein
LFCQPAFGDAADNGKGGVEEIADIVANHLPHRVAGGAGAQPVMPQRQELLFAGGNLSLDVNFSRRDGLIRLRNNHLPE